MPGLNDYLSPEDWVKLQGVSGPMGLLNPYFGPGGNAQPQQPQNPYAGTGMEQFRAATGQAPVTQMPPSQPTTMLDAIAQHFATAPYRTARATQQEANVLQGGQMSTDVPGAQVFDPQAPLSIAQMMMGRMPFAGRGTAGVSGGRLLQPGETPIRAYHGSPYDFEKFDINKIGAGEGAQAYGHGLYFAENEPTALTYKHSTTDLKDWPISGGDPGWRVPSWVGKTIQSSPHGIDEMINTFSNRVAEAKATNHWNVGGLQDIVDALKAVKTGKAELKKPGHMYEVNINTRPEQMLDWDKPLSQQPSQLAGIQHPELQRFFNLAPEARGDVAYQALGGGQRAADILQQAGIPGIKYLDQASRGGGTGTSNYTLFRDDIIDIIRKYGIAGLMGLGVAQQTMQQPKAQ